MFLKSISILLLIFENYFHLEYWNLNRLVASNLEPFIKIGLPYFIKNLLFNVATSIFLKKKIYFLKLNPSILNDFHLHYNLICKYQYYLYLF